MEKRTAFSRALGFLNFKPAARWLALGASLATGLLSLALLLVLGLFADLVVHQGQVPTLIDLPAPEREQLTQQWQQLTAEERTQLLRASGLISPPEVSDGPTPAPEALPPGQRELLWQATVLQLLNDRVSPEAAQTYRTSLSSGRANLGILGLVVRTRDHFYGRPIGWLASRLGWSASGAEGDHSRFAYLFALVGLGLGLGLIRAVLLFAAEYTAALVTIEAATRMRRAVYHHTYRLGTLAIRSLGPSEAVSMFTRHIESVADALYVWLTVSFRAPFTFVVLLLLAFLVNFWLTLLAVLLAGLAWLVGSQLVGHFQERENNANRHAANQLALLQESLMIMRLVKCYLMEIVNQNRVEHQLGGHVRWQRRRARGEALLHALLAFLGLVAGVLMLFFAGVSLLDGQTSAPALILLAATLTSLVGPVRSWLDHWKPLRRGKESAATLFKFLDRPGEVGQVVGAEVLPPLAKRLEFDNVSVREPGTNRILLQDVSFAIPAGARVALVGPEDLEKHALVYLIPRFLDPTSGEIRIDDHNLRWVSLDSLRKQIAVVLQHNLVFNDTVTSNIRCGDTSIKQPKIVEAAKLAHAHQFILKLPRGYDTAIGEMGHSLTVGEQFRIALARAIVRNPALLIIEEPPAFHLDEDAQDLLDDTLNRVLPGRTIIFLPHRRATLERCNQIFVIHKGKLEARGEHADLLKQSELYRHLHYSEFSPLAGQLS